MRFRLPTAVLWLVALLGVGPTAAVGDEEEPRVEPAMQTQIDMAIERGVAWLLTQQRKDGSYPGFGDRLPANTYDPLDVGLNALVVQTLAHGGVAADHDAIRRCLDFCRFHYSGGKGSWNLRSNGKVLTYTAATLILALLAVHAPAAADPPAVKRDRYGAPIPPKPVKCKLPAADRRWIQELVDLIVAGQVKPSGGWRYPGNPVGSEEGETDLSNTQYALLALDAAARCAIDAPPETWLLAAEHVLREQEEEGVEVGLWIPNPAWEPGQGETERFLEAGKAQTRGWCYLPGHVALPTGSMTCAGVTCLALAKERLWALKRLEPGLVRRLDRGLLDGLAWLQEHFTVADNPDPPNLWHYYYLYGLERTGAKTGVRFVGRHDWYREGAAHLLAAQMPDGAWQSAEASGKPADNTESAITQTCFAILFLKRATAPPAIPVAPPVLTGGGGVPSDGR